MAHLLDEVQDDPGGRLTAGRDNEGWTFYFEGVTPGDFSPGEHYTFGGTVTEYNAADRSTTILVKEWKTCPTRAAKEALKKELEKKIDES